MQSVIQGFSTVGLLPNCTLLRQSEIVDKNNEIMDLKVEKTSQHKQITTLTTDKNKIFDELKSSRSDIALSSDFIVGFPDETDKDFYETMELIQKIKFSIAYSFMYSPRPGTPAYRKDNIDIQIKKARLSAMQSLLKEQQSNYNKKFFKKNLDVLFDRKGRHNNQFVGRTIYNQSVFCSSSKNLIGKILNTKIVDTTNFALEGSIWMFL